MYVVVLIILCYTVVVVKVTTYVNTKNNKSTQSNKVSIFECRVDGHYCPPEQHVLEREKKVEKNCRC